MVSMNEKIMQIPVSDLLDSLKSGYEEYIKCVKNGHDGEDLAHIKGFCTTIEQIISSYGGVTKAEMLAIKRPIIGEISLRRAKPKVNYEVPTFIRRQQD